jgi:hypothetical protein
VSSEGWARTSDFDELLQRAESGDSTALPLLKEVFDQVPSLWKMAGDLGAQATASIIEAAAGSNAVAREAMIRALETFRAELNKHSTSPLERLLVDRIATCWLQVNYYETLYSQNTLNLTPQQSEAQQRRLSQAHNRYLSAVRALAQVKWLLAPTIQVNIAENQMNVAQVAHVDAQSAMHDNQDPS